MRVPKEFRHVRIDANKIDIKPVDDDKAVEKHVPKEEDKVKKKIPIPDQVRKNYFSESKEKASPWVADGGVKQILPSEID